MKWSELMMIVLRVVFNLSSEFPSGWFSCLYDMVVETLPYGILWFGVSINEQLPLVGQGCVHILCSVLKFYSHALNVIY
jgi:hypothetical protein